MRTGVWIDTKKAVIVRVKDKRSITIDSGIEKRVREKGESKQYSRFHDQYLSPEKSKQNKQLEQAKDFFGQIKKRVSNSEAIVLFGPAQMKFELEKYLRKNMSPQNKWIGVETADSMTDNQVTAWVTGYFD